MRFELQKEFQLITKSSKIKKYFCSYSSVNYGVSDKYRIIYVLDGSFSLEVKGRKNELKKGDISIVNPCEIWKVLNATDDNLSIIMEIEKDFVQNPPFEFITPICKGINPFQQEETIEIIRYIFRESIKSFENPSEDNVSNIEKIIKALFVKKYLLIEAEKNNIDELLLKKSNNLVYEIFKNPDDKYDLKDIAKDIFVSSSYVSKVFFQITGVFYSEALRLSRLQKAMYLLSETNNSILSVSELSGFNTDKSFYENFKKYIGMPPNEFRKSLKKAEGNRVKYNSLESCLDYVKENESFKCNNFKLIQQFEEKEYIKKYNVDFEITPIKKWINHWKKLGRLSNIKDKNLDFNQIKNDFGYQYIYLGVCFSERQKTKDENIFYWDEDERDLADIIRKMDFSGHKGFIEIFIPKPELYKDDINDYFHKILHQINDFMLFLRYSVSHMQSSQWKVNLHCLWLFDEKYDSVKGREKFYVEILNILSKYFSEKFIGINLGIISLHNGNRIKTFIGKVNTQFKVGFYCVEEIDAELFSLNSDRECIFIRTELIVEKVLDFLFNKNRILHENVFEIYILKMAMYFDFNVLPKEYWESINTLHSVSIELLRQKSKVSINHFNYYDYFFKDKEIFFEKVDDYVLESSLINSLGVKNTSYYLYKFFNSMGEECIYEKNGMIVTKKGEGYQVLLYQNMEESINYLKSEKERFDRYTTKNVIRFDGIYGKYLVRVQKLKSKERTFMHEWKKIGSPSFLSDFECEYLKSQTLPELFIKEIETNGIYDFEIELGLFEIVFLQLEKII